MKAFAELLAETRANNLAFREAVVRHERAHTNPPHTRPLLQADGRGGGSSRGGRNNPVNTSDSRVAPRRATNVPRRVPRSLSNRIFWDVVKIRSTISTSSSGLVETNYNWTLSTHPQSSSLSALFDQWCIPQVSVSFRCTEAPSGPTSVPELHTALDFDNAATLGTIAQIDQFATSQVDLLLFNKTVTRSVRPCVKPDIQGGNAYGVTQMWVDCGAPATPHYGIRSIIAPSSTGSVVIVVETTLWYAFTNII